MDSPPKGIWRVRNLVAALVLSAMTVLLVLRATGGAPDLAALKRIRFSYLLICFGLVLAEWLLEAWRLWLLSRAIGDKVTVRGVLRAVFVGAFFARVTPFSTGGEPFQVYALHRDGVPIGHATAVVAVKAILNGLTRLGLGLVIPGWAFLTTRAWRLGRAASIALWVGLAVYLGILVVALVAAFFYTRGWDPGTYFRRSRWLRRFFAHERLELIVDLFEEHFRSFMGALQHFGKDRRNTVVLVGMLTVATWGAVLAVPVILVRALGGGSPAGELAVTAIVFYLAVSYAPTPGSSGASEAGFAILFAPFVPLPLLGVLVIIWRLLTHYLGLLLGLLVTALSLRRSKTKPYERATGHDRPVTGAGEHPGRQC